MKTTMIDQLTDGDIVWAQVPFENGTGSKIRPVVFVSKTNENITVLKMTTKYSRKSWYFKERYVPVHGAMNKNTFVDVNKFIHINQNALKSYYGHLSQSDYNRVVYRLNTKTLQHEEML